MLLTTRNICDLFKISHTTAKAWASTYAEFLSDSAAPGATKHATFTEQDLLVFSFVVDAKRRGMSHDDIFASLKNGMRGEFPPTFNEHALTLDSREQLALYENRISQLQAEIERLKPFERENIELTILLKKAQTDLEAARNRIEHLAGENAVLKYRLENNKSD